MNPMVPSLKDHLQDAKSTAPVWPIIYTLENIPAGSPKRHLIEKGKSSKASTLHDFFWMVPAVHFLTQPKDHEKKVQNQICSPQKV